MKTSVGSGCQEVVVSVASVAPVRSLVLVPGTAAPRRPPDVLNVFLFALELFGGERD
jgi:hypothetical protein